MHAEESTLTKPTLQVVSMKTEGLTLDVNLKLDGPADGQYSLVIQRQLNAGAYTDYVTFNLSHGGWANDTNDQDNPKSWFSYYDHWNSGIRVYGKEWETSHELRFHDEHLPEGYNCRYRFRVIYQDYFKGRSDSEISICIFKEDQKSDSNSGNAGICERLCYVGGRDSAKMAENRTCRRL